MWLRCLFPAVLAAALISCASQPCVAHCGPEAQLEVLRYLELGMCERAHERAKLALEYNPDEAPLHNLLGMVMLTCTPNDPEPAIARFKLGVWR